jgi:P-type Ca2+ transporter type 2C
MHRQHMLVKSLQIIETFNSVSVIATDKAAILTQNKMIVTHLLWDTHGVYEVPMLKPVHRETVLQKIGADIANEVQNLPFRDLLLCAALCNNAEAKIGQDVSNMESELHLVGDATDIALYDLCVDRYHVDIAAIRRINPRLKVLPFNSSNKLMISANQLQSNDSLVVESDPTILITMKGAPDTVIQRCSSYKTSENETSPLTEEMRGHLLNRRSGFGKVNRTDVK